MKNIKSRIEKIIKLISDGLYEREEIVSLTLLSAIAGKPIFLYGPPGTAKSFIAKRISSAFKDAKYFGYLMQRFSTPEDIFGPISLEELKNDRYVRKIEGYLPDSDFAFLDEIWKSTPAILNTLLTIINERVFKNGNEEIKVPLKALISASNETPPEGQGLEALYDRFIVRLMVNNIKSRDNFEKILENTQLDSYINIDDELKISNDEWGNIRKEVNNIKLSKEVIDIIHNIKLSIEKFNEDNRDIAIYVSDRRWQHISYLLKTAAYLNEKNEVDIYESILIYNCLWSLEEHIESVKKIAENAISICYDLNNQNINEWRESFKSVQKNIDDEFYNLEKTYNTENIDDKPHIAKTLSINIDEYGNKGETIIYIPIKQLGKKGYFYPLDIGRNQTRKFRCNFNATDKCTIEINSATASNGFVSGMLSKNYEFLTEAEPDFYMKKVSPKKLEKEKKDSYLKLINSLISSIENIIVNFKNDFNKNKYSNKSVFISDEKFNFFTEMFNSYIENLESEKLDAQRLKSEIEQHETI
ncbi:Pyrrolo-quinoline quinone [Brachyspira hampsonii 30446]|uniref:Pyrrolo-quinoline quinone n=2 Tax=Brachyspira hampsonii TaxID=1287055 RepID=A0A2U4FGI2_9SPIR|nr:AAA family ATPase [Brachyspira hampsonii]EKV56251.1 Pyrrolo-quinoline quinone [Brachyspira hampsonii 30446]OEJ17156.1 pyrrolo-quinoline quinone [Brachyspira hampsonii]